VIMQAGDSMSPVAMTAVVGPQDAPGECGVLGVRGDWASPFSVKPSLTVFWAACLLLPVG
jgi:hypothetical protein